MPDMLDATTSMSFAVTRASSSACVIARSVASRD